MTDNGYDEHRIAEDALNFAKRAVDTATAQVDEVSRHFSDAVEKARQPETYLELLKKATVAAPGDGFHRRYAIWPKTSRPLTRCR